MKSVNGRLLELQRIAPAGAEIVYGGHAWIAPNRWVSSEIVQEFIDRGFVIRDGDRISVTTKGQRVLEGRV